MSMTKNTNKKLHFRQATIINQPDLHECRALE